MVVSTQDLCYAPVLKELSLQFSQGCFSTIIGPNGAGKTTLLRLLSGLLRPTSGTVDTGGQLISLVPQSPSAPFPFTVWDLVSMGRYPHGDRNGEKIAHAMELTRVTHLQEKPIDEISAGERQRVFLARSLASEAPVLLLDEPTSNLDIGHKQEIWELLQQLAHDSRTVIATTHDLSMVETYADEVVILHQGRHQASGTPSDLLTESLIHEVFAPCVP